MAFLRSVPRRCCAGKKLTKCGTLPLPVVGLLENTAAMTTAAATRTPPFRLVTQVRDDTRGYATAAATDVRKQQQQQQSAAPRQIDPLDLKFNDPVAAFKSKTTTELVRAYFVYQMCSIEYIVENNMKVRVICTHMFFVCYDRAPSVFWNRSCRCAKLPLKTKKK